jgi:hypothetical protein
MTHRRCDRQRQDHHVLEFYLRGDISYDVAISNTREPEAIRQRSAGIPRASA